MRSLKVHLWNIEDFTGWKKCRYKEKEAKFLSYRQ